MITLKSFGVIAEKLKTSELTVQSFPNTDTLKGFLFQQYPELQHLKFSIAVNRELTVGNTPLPPNAEVALLPPFSGG